MIRRSPTRIDLRLDDLQEYDVIKKELEAKKEADRQIRFSPSWGGKASTFEIQERIGYIPPAPAIPQQPAHSRPTI